MTRRVVELLVVVLTVAALAEAGSKKIDVGLRVLPELKLDGTETVFLGPFMLEPASDRSIEPVDVNAMREFERFLFKLLRRETRLNVLPPDTGLRPPTDDPIELWAMREFWQELGSTTGAEIIVAASIDVEVLDRSGYQTEEYVSPEDGRTYYRQVLVEETGFDFNILLMVFDGRTGEVRLREQISSFKQRPEKKLNQITDLFSELYNLEQRLSGIFVPRIVPARRFLYTE